LKLLLGLLPYCFCKQMSYEGSIYFAINASNVVMTAFHEQRNSRESVATDLRRNV